MNAYIYLEGGGESKELHTRCREGFRKLFERCGFSGRLPRLVACGTRRAAYDDFTIAHDKAGQDDYVALLVDSEDPVTDIEKPWEHLTKRDGWNRPRSAMDEQVLLMVTCMETWIVTDKNTLRSHYGANLQETALPSR